MEPEFDGSQNDMINGFNKIKSLLGNPQNILHTNKVLEDYDRTNKTFDYILMHNSINHIDEDACITLLENDNSKKKYTQFFTLLREISHPGTILIICDCARSNFYSSINLKNPFAKSIEWEKHQNPSVWSNLLQQSGYKPLSTSWVSFNALGKIGGVFTANKLVSYFTNSHFKLVMQYTNN